MIEKNKGYKKLKEFSRELRIEILYEEQKGRCLICGLSEWIGNQIPFEEGHIDGNNQNDKKTM